MNMSVYVMKSKKRLVKIKVVLGQYTNDVLSRKIAHLIINNYNHLMKYLPNTVYLTRYDEMSFAEFCH